MADLVVEADRIVWIGGQFVAERGHASLPSGTVTFEKAVFDPKTGAILGEGVTGTTCPCDGPDLWSVEAKKAEIYPGDRADVEGAWLRVLDRRIAPLPKMTLPLARRSGLLLPIASVGYDGLRLALPYYQAPKASWDVTWTPEVRTGRAIRLTAEPRLATRAATGSAHAMVAWDWLDQQPRMSLESDIQGRVGEVWWAERTRAVSDRDVWADYGNRLLDRQLPWGETRAVLRAPNWEVGHRSLQALDAPTSSRVAQELGYIQLYQPVFEERGVVGSAAIRATAWGGARQAVEATGWAHVSRPVAVGPAQVVPEARVTLRGATDAVLGSGTVLGRGEIQEEADFYLRVVTPAWRSTGSAFERFIPEITATARVDALGLDPGVRSRVAWRRTVGQRWFDLDSSLAFTSRNGWTLDARAGAAAGAWSGQALVDTGAHTGVRRAFAQFTGDISGWTPYLRGIFDGATAVGRLAAGTDVVLPGRANAWTLGAGAAWAQAPGDWVERYGHIAWKHPSGCLGVDLSFRVDADRAWPDVAVRVEGRSGVGR